MSERTTVIFSAIAVIVLLIILSPRLFTEEEAAEGGKQQDGTIVIEDSDAQERESPYAPFRSVQRTITSLFSKDGEPIAPPPDISSDSGISPPSITAVDEEQSPLHAYGNVLAATLRAQGEVGRENTAIFNDFLENPTDEQAVAALSGVAEQYENLTTALSRIEVPSVAQTPHSAIVSGYRDLAAAIREIVTNRNDTEARKSALRAYNAVSLHASDTVIDIAFFFKEQGITFSSSEPGSVFTLIP